MKDIFWTYPAEAESGKTIIVTGRDCVDTQRLSGKYPYRLSVSWDYTPLPDGMPDDADARMMEQATDLLLAETARDSAVILTGIYTGDGTRDWIFYTRSLFIFPRIRTGRNTSTCAPGPIFPRRISRNQKQSPKKNKSK